MNTRGFPLFRWLQCVVLLLLTAGGLCYGQDINASLSGTVTDSSGAAIPDAKLTLTNEATGFKTTLVTTATGEYNFTNLTPGRYSLAANATGFKSVV